MRRFPGALQLFERLNDEAAGENSNATRSALGVTHFGSAVLSSADEHYVLL